MRTKEYNLENPRGRVPMTITMTETERDDMQRMANEANTSKSELIRFALAKLKETGEPIIINGRF